MFLLTEEAVIDGRKCSSVSSHNQSVPAEVSSVGLDLQQANRRKLRELKETIREKESHLKTLQRSTREKEDLLKQNETKLDQLQLLMAREQNKMADIKRSRGKRDLSLRLRQHESSLHQYKERCKAINSYLNILRATQIPSVEVDNLASRLQELRCELQEVETSVRMDDERKMRLQDLRNNRPRKTEENLPKEADCDLEEALKGEPIFSESVRVEKVAVGGEEHITLKRERGGPSGASKAVVALNGLSQPHKRRLITSSSEQVNT